MFPTDTKNAYYDDHGGVSGILLPRANFDRTALYATEFCEGGGDNHIILGSTLTQPNQNNFIDSEHSPRSGTFVYRLIPANTDVYYSKESAVKDCSFSILYVDYNLMNSSTSTQNIIYSNGISLKQGFTYGEVLIILLLLMIFTQAFFSELKQWIFGVRIENPLKNKYNKDV